MSYHLVVREPFGQYAKGTLITAPDEVALILASPQHTHVTKRAAPQDEPAPAPAATVPPPVSFGHE